jgi:hypothetical protein
MTANNRAEWILLIVTCEMPGLEEAGKTGQQNMIGLSNYPGVESKYLLAVPYGT